MIEEKTIQQKIIEAVREALGTRFVHQGRLVGSGIDCVGLLVHAAKTLGLPHHDERAYPIAPRKRWLEEVLAKSLTRIDPEEAGPGDVLCFWIRKPDSPQHVAVLNESGGMIHTYADVGKVVEHGLDEFWKKRVSSAWRYEGAV